MHWNMFKYAFVCVCVCFFKKLQESFTGRSTSQVESWCCCWRAPCMRLKKIPKTTRVCVCVQVFPSVVFSFGCKEKKQIFILKEKSIVSVRVWRLLNICISYRELDERRRPWIWSHNQQLLSSAQHNQAAWLCLVDRDQCANVAPCPV